MHTLARTICFLIIASFGFTFPGICSAEEQEALVLLKRMSEYLAAQQTFQLSYDSSIEIITPQLEKIQFTNSGSVVVVRPDKLFAQRKGGHNEVSLVFDGTTASIYEKQTNGYLQLAAPGNLDQLIDALRRGEGVALPGADLLLSNSYEVLAADVMEAKIIGQGIIGGQACDHLAFRNFDTDWQIWIASESNPAPCKMVVTTKTMSSGPQYTLLFTEWNPSFVPQEGMFDFTPPANAKELDPEALITLDELPPDANSEETK
jgi:hypothetical protein